VAHSAFFFGHEGAAAMTTSDERNPYQPPRAPLNAERPIESSGGSFDDAIAGRYDFRIGEVMGEAWGLVNGFKGSFWAASIVVYALLLAVMFAWRAVFGDGPNFLVRLLVQLVLTALWMPLAVGLIGMAVRRAAGQPVKFSMAFSYLDRAPVFIVAGFLTTALTYVGLILLVIPGIYLSVAWGLTLPLLAFSQLRPWDAMEASRKAITHHWWRVFFLYMAVGILTGLSALALLIPLIWTAPWALLVLGVLYRRMFGVPADAATT
jgi:hypothetical protein